MLEPMIPMVAVDPHVLRVKEEVAKQVDPHARGQQPVIERALRQVDEALVHDVGEHEIHLDSTGGSGAHRAEHVLIRDEIGRDDHRALSRLVKLPHEQRLEPFEWIFRPRRKQLEQGVAS